MLLGRTDEQEMDEDSDDAEEMDVDVQNEPESCKYLISISINS